MFENYPPARPPSALPKACRRATLCARLQRCPPATLCVALRAGSSFGQVALPASKCLAMQAGGQESLEIQ